MKTLFLVRHAEAEYPVAALKDRQRRLTQTGISEAHELGRRFLTLSAPPQRIFHSGVERTMATAEIISTVLNIPESCNCPLTGLYEANAEQLLERIQENALELDTVMVVAHNPAISDLAMHLCKGFLNVFPPSGLAAITFKAGCWFEIGRSSGHMNYFITGRSY